MHTYVQDGTLTTLPPDAEPLDREGYYAHATDLTVYGLRINIYRLTDTEIEGQPAARMWPAFDVVPPRRTAWHAFAEPREYLWQVRHVTSMTGQPVQAEVFGEALMYAGRIADTLSENGRKILANAEAEREKRERERREYAERMQREREQRTEQMRKERDEIRRRVEAERELQMERVKELYEILKWHVGDKFRLRRDGYRSTVFGTLDSIHVSHYGTAEGEPTYHATIRSTSEKGKRMHMNVRDICLFELKDPDNGRKYTTIYDDRKEK